MANRERRLERAEWFMRRDLQEVGADLRGARLSAGLTLQAVARRLGVSPADVMRRERGDLPGSRATVLARHAAAVGMRARIRVYPEGAPIRDAAQVELLRAFRSRLPVGTPFEVEVPVTDDARDFRAWDAVILLNDCRCAVECVTRFHDCQAQLRQFQMKLRDSDVDRLLVVVKATHANRRALAAAADVIASNFPLNTRTVLRVLGQGETPTGSGLVLL